MKNNILARLYHGNLEPMSNVFKEANRHPEELKAVEEAENRLKSTFSKQQNNLYDELNAAQSEINTIIEDAAFAEGFNLAVQIMTATYYENDDSLMKKWSSFLLGTQGSEAELQVLMEEKQNEKNT